MVARARWLDVPPPSWEALLEHDLNAGPGHRRALPMALADVIPGCRACFLAVEEEGELLGGLPVVFERRMGLEWLRALPFTLPGAPVARLGSHAAVDRLVAESLAAATLENRVVGGEWVLFRPVGPAVASAAVERVVGETRIATTDVLDLADGAAAAYRRVGRREREAIATTSARGIRCSEDPEALEAVYALYAAQSQHWPGHRPKPLALFRRLLQGDTPVGRLFTVQDSRGLLSGTLALVSQHEWMVWWSGSHPDARRRHGFVSLLWSIAESAAREGARRLNLGASAGLDRVASFKHGLGAREMAVPIRWIGADHASAWGRWAAVIQHRLRARRWRGAPE
jgi:hypothetical protein